MRLDSRDVLYLGGLLLIGAGCWVIAPALALIVVGSLLILTAVLPLILRRGGDG